MAGVAEHLTRTVLPDGRELRLPPAAVETGRDRFDRSPRYGEHTVAILREVGLDGQEIEALEERGVVR